MPESMKNRDLLPVGTRVRRAHDKLSTSRGDVVEHTEDGRMYVCWNGATHANGDPQVTGPYMPAELRPAK